jgi:hypothetical protein
MPFAHQTKAINEELSKQGEPLRWAITEVNTITQTAQIEAIVTTGQVQS